ncbi:hypothetical protein T02_8540 [Trichinella nativa]|uniref:Apple domain-containing protein n=1 Tax=Trichinella nativa TaxID=6335 RepID=A0A0V1KPY5_9BILA|nr:hypothetical protein T02_8540 [Trichinella nativa]
MNHRIEVESKGEMPRQNKTCAIKNAVLKQHIFFTVIFITNFGLTNCNWMSVYVPKLDATCALIPKKINDFEAYYIERQFCSFESCVAICFQHRYPCNSIKYTRFAKQCELYIRNATYYSLPEDDETGQSRHLLLHSCHKEIAAVSVGKLIHTSSMDTDAMTADIHLPSIHRVCVVQKRPFVESYGIQRLEQITTSSLRRCLAACEAPTYSSCNSVLFSVQEETCILLARPQAFRFLGGTAATVETAAQFFIILICRNDFTGRPSYKLQSFSRQPVIAYAASNLHMQIGILHELFYGSKAAIRLLLWNSADEKECLKICIASITTDYCDAYYFSSRENTCLTMRMKKQYASPTNHGHLIVTKFYDDRETERANNVQHVFCFIPELDEMCLLELYEPLELSGWKIITRIENTFSLQECLLKCASVMNVQKCSAVNFINQQCVLFSRAKRASFVRSVYSVFAELLYCE